MPENSASQNGGRNFKKGIVKQVLTGDSLVLQSLNTQTGGPPKELTVYLANVTAPRLAKRPTNDDGSTDEAYAWEAREFLRKKLIGKTVVFATDFTTTSGREHGRVYLGGTKMEDSENVAENAVAEGWLEVRPGKQPDEHTQKLLEAQEKAKEEKKGRWSGEDPKKHIRDIRWTVGDMQATFAEWKNRELEIVVEQVRDGSTMRVFLPDFQYITVMLSGVKTPSARIGNEGKAEEFGEEARFFVESRLLQRDVKLVLEGTNNQNFVGSIIHPRGNIAEFLLKEGYAKCVEWSLGLATSGVQPLRQAERYAKEHKLRLWRNYVGPTSAFAPASHKSISAKVIEIGLVDNFMIKPDNGEEMRVYLSSLRPPRRDGPGAGGTPQQPPRPLFDTPFMLEAREFLRKRLIGKKVTVTIDYVQPEAKPFPEKTFATLLLNGKNVAEMLIAKGLAKVIRHRQDDDNRSSHYDALLAAETQAESDKVGMWNVKESANGTATTSAVRVKELQGDPQRSRQFLPYLQRSNRIEAIVEHVFSGSRMRLYIPKESSIITFLLSGIKCPLPRRGGPAMGRAPIEDGEPFSAEALNFARTQCMQHDVQIEVETMDKAGAFIGYLFVAGEKPGAMQNLSELLVEHGLASVHFTAERSPYYGTLLAAEKRAKAAKLGLWHAHVEEDTAEQKAQEQAADVAERKVNSRKAIVTEVYPEMRFACQFFDDGPAIEALMHQLQAQMGADGPGPLAVVRRGQMAAVLAKDTWQRVKIESVKGNKAEVVHVDFGNRETVSTDSLSELPKQFHSQPPGAKEYQLAFVQTPKDPHYAEYATSALERLCYAYPHLYLNVEYKISSGLEAVTLATEGPHAEDIGEQLVANGNALVEPRREPRFQKLLGGYQEAECNARRRRLSIWEYGDFTGSDM